MVLVLLILTLHLVQVLARHLSGSIDGLARTVLGRIDAAEHEDEQGVFAIICQCQMIQALLAQSSCAGILLHLHDHLVEPAVWPHLTRRQRMAATTQPRVPLALA